MPLNGIHVIEHHDREKFVEEVNTFLSEPPFDDPANARLVTAGRTSRGWHAIFQVKVFQERYDRLPMGSEDKPLHLPIPQQAADEFLARYERKDTRNPQEKK